MYLSRTFLEVLWAARRLFSHRCEFLAAWTKMCTALSDDDTFDRRTPTPTPLYLQVGKPGKGIIITSLPPHIPIVVERCFPARFAELDEQTKDLLQEFYLPKGER